MINNVNVVLMDLDHKSNEMVVKNEDDSYTIFLNSRKSYECLCKAYAHAIYHIEAGHFNREDVQEIEKEAHDS